MKMKKIRKCLAGVLAIAVSANLLFAGSLVANAQEDETNPTGVTGVSVRAANEGEEIYTTSDIKIDVSYSINSDVSVTKTELWFAKEDVALDDLEDAIDSDEGSFCTSSDTDSDGVIEVSGNAPRILGTQVLKRIILCTSDNEEYQYDYVSSGDNEGKLQAVDSSQYIEGCTFDVVGAPYFLTVDSLTLDTGGANRNKIKQGSTIYLNVGLENHTEKDITLITFGEDRSFVQYDYIKEGTDWLDGKSYNLKDSIVVPANGKKIVEIPMTLSGKGRYVITRISMSEQLTKGIRKLTLEEDSSGNMLEAVNYTSNGSYLVQEIDRAPLNFTVVDPAEVIDTEAPEISSITKKTTGPIYSGTPVEFDVSYADDASSVEEIDLYFKGEAGGWCTGSVCNTEDEGLESEKTDILGQSGSVTIESFSGSEDKSGLGKYELDHVDITDVCGNTRVYSDETPYGEESSMETQSYTAEEMTPWETWKEACAFEKIIFEEGVRVTDVAIKGVKDKNDVKAGANFAVDVTVQNNGTQNYTIGSCQLRWEKPWTEDEDYTEVVANMETEITVATGEKATVTVPVQLDENESCGKRLLRGIYLSDTENNDEISIRTEITEDGSACNFYGSNVTEEPESLDADFAVHNFQTVTNKATVYKDGSIVKKCARCGETSSFVRIPYPKNISLSSTDFTYSGKVQTPAVSVVGSDGRAISASNYSVYYSGGRKNIGHYAVTVTFGGNYSGSVTKIFNINPKGTKLSSVRAGKKKATVKWKKQTKYTKGYQIQYSSRSDFKADVKTKTVSGNKKKSVVLKGLKSKKVYYVRIRTYQNAAGGKCYSTWSSVKKVKAK